MNPKQFLYEMYEGYCDLTNEQRQAVKRDIAVYASPEFQLAMAIAELNGSTKQIVADLQTLRTGVCSHGRHTGQCDLCDLSDLQSLRKGA